MRKVEPSKVYRLMYPSVPALVAASREGRTSAMPVVSIISLSNDPALVGFSSSPDHDTLSAVLGAKRFSVSWLGSEHRRAIETMGSTSGREQTDKLRSAGVRYRLRGTPPVPIIEDASAFVVCFVAETRKFGDHELVVGRVEEAKADPDFAEYWRFKSYRPMLYTGMGRKFPPAARG